MDTLEKDVWRQLIMSEVVISAFGLFVGGLGFTNNMSYPLCYNCMPYDPCYRVYNKLARNNPCNNVPGYKKEKLVLARNFCLVMNVNKRLPWLAFSSQHKRAVTGSMNVSSRFRFCNVSMEIVCLKYHIK
jgi:hypothetical protein